MRFAFALIAGLTALLAVSIVQHATPIGITVITIALGATVGFTAVVALFDRAQPGRRQAVRTAVIAGHRLEPVRGEVVAFRGPRLALPAPGRQVA